MERRELIKIVRRWWWLLVLAAMAAGTAAYWLAQGDASVYESRSRLIVGPGVKGASPDLDDLRAGGHLMRTYAELPTTNPLLERIIDRLNLNMSPDTLRDMIELRPNEETQILSILVRAPTARSAVRIANEVADTVILISPSAEDSAAGTMMQQMQAQADQLEQTLPRIEEQIEALEDELQGAQDSETQRFIIDRLERERARLSDTHRTLAILYESLQNFETNQVTLIEPAVSAEPVPSLLWLKVAIGGLLGLVLSSTVAFGHEYLSENANTIRDGSQVRGVPVLGALAPYSPDGSSGPEDLAVYAAPDSQTAEDYRRIGVKLLFAGQNGQAPRSILLSSVDPCIDVGESAANFAVVLAATGKRVILIDTNLHRPSVGQYFDVVHRCGLTDVLTGECRALDMATVDWAPGLSILPSGSSAYDAFVLLASPRMSSLLRTAQTRADVVLIAGSAVSAFAHTLFLASRVDSVILLAETGRTRRKALENAVASLGSVNAHLLGIALYKTRPFAAGLSRRLRTSHSLEAARPKGPVDQAPREIEPPGDNAGDDGYEISWSPGKSSRVERVLEE